MAAKRVFEGGEGPKRRGRRYRRKILQVNHFDPSGLFSIPTSGEEFFYFGENGWESQNFAKNDPAGWTEHDFSLDGDEDDAAWGAAVESSQIIMLPPGLYQATYTVGSSSPLDVDTDGVDAFTPFSGYLDQATYDVDFFTASGNSGDEPWIWNGYFGPYGSSTLYGTVANNNNEISFWTGEQMVINDTDEAKPYHYGLSGRIAGMTARFMGCTVIQL